MSLSKFKNSSLPNLNIISTQSSLNLNNIFPQSNSSQISNSEELTFLQINLNHCKDANTNLVTYITENKIDIIALQDPYLRNKNLFGFPLDWIKHSSENGSAWIVVANKSLIVNKQQSFRSSAFITVQTNNSTYIIGSQYCPPSENLKLNLDEWIGPLITAKNDKILIMGDFNASSPQWSKNNLNIRGRILQSFLTQHGLTVFNDPNSPPTFSRNNKFGWIDLLLTTNSLKNDITNWKVLNNIDSLSDHFYVTFNLNFEIPHLLQNRYQTKFSNHKKFITNFKYRNSILLNNLTNINNTFELENFTSQLITDITNTCEISYPKRKIKQTGEFKWWNVNLTIQRNKLNALRRRLVHSQPGEEMSITLKLKRERAIYKKMINNSKSSAWRKFCESQSNKFGTGFKLAHFKSFQPHHVQAKWEDLGFASKEEALRKLTCYLFDDSPADSNINNSLNSQLIDDPPQPLNLSFSNDFSPTSSQNIIHSSSPLPQSNSNHCISPSSPSKNSPQNAPTLKQDSNPITKHEISLALSTLNPNKAPGPDGLDFRIIHQLNKHFNNLLLKWIKLCFKFNYFPKILRQGEIVYFNKLNKDLNDPENYRPICLLPTLGKLIEKIIVNRLYYYLENNNTLSNLQFGFRPGKSCELALKKLHSTVLQNRNNNFHTLAISCDIKKAFDSIDRSTIISQMKNLNCPQNLTLMVESFLSNRNIIINWGIGSDSYPSNRGCPQGSCLGPLCWLFIAESFLKNNKETEDLKIICFADDFLFLVRGKHRRILETKGQKIFNKFHSWCSQNNLQLSNSKTVITTFTKKRDILKRKPTIKLLNKSLKHSDELKYLGLTFNRTLTWSNHLNYLYQKVTRFSLNYNSFSTHNWGINGNLLKTWYLTVIERILLYGACIWGHNLNKTEIKKINSIQRIFLLKITRAYRTAPTSALHILAGIPPLHLTLKKEAVTQSVTHTHSDASWDTLHFKHTDYQKLSNKQFLHPSYKNFPQTDNYLKEIIKKPHQIFTDGSKTDTGTASAFIHYHNNLLKKKWKGTLKPNNSSFQAEYIAIKEALNYCIINKFQNINILTDSRSTIEAIQNQNQRNTDINDIQKTLHNLKNNHSNLSIHWIKAHQGTQGNEEADILAKSATTETPNIFIPLPKSFLKSTLNSYLFQLWQSYWDKHDKGRFTYTLIPKLQKHICSYNFAVNCFLTDHGPFPAYLCKFNKIDSPFCVCGSLGNSLHYLTECPITTQFHIKKPDETNFQTWFRSIFKSKMLLTKIKNLITWLIDNQEDILNTS